MATLPKVNLSDEAKRMIAEARARNLKEACEWLRACLNMVDGDVDSNGRMMDCTTYKLITGWRQLEELCEALGIERKRMDESLMDAIDRHSLMPAP